jgi:hypothetical protein
MHNGMVNMKVVTSLTPRRAKPRTILSPTRKAGIALNTSALCINPDSTQMYSGSHSMQLAVSCLHGCVRPLFSGRLFNGSVSRREAPHQKYRLERLACISRLKGTECHVNAANSAIPQLHKMSRHRLRISGLDTRSGGVSCFGPSIDSDESNVVIRRFHQCALLLRLLRHFECNRDV